MKLILILLAAGDSRRFKGNKLLYEFGGKPMYRYIAEEIEKLPVSLFYKKIVVTQYEEIGRDLKQYNYEVVENKESILGISHSIYLALDMLQEQSDEAVGYCFAVCDQPYIKAATIKNLAEGFAASGKGIGCLFSKGEFGNPVFFSQRYRQELLELHGDVGGKRVLRRHTDDLYLYEVSDEMEITDIDVRL